MEDYDGRQVVGMGLHRHRSVLVRMTEDGRRLGTAKITSSAAELRREIARAGKHPRVVQEATYGWYWAVLIQLRKVSEKALREAITDGWLACAPPKLTGQYLKRRAYLSGPFRPACGQP